MLNLKRGKIMKKGRIKRNRLVILSGMLSFFFAISEYVTPEYFINYIDVISAAFSFSALATALFLSAFSIIPAFSNSKMVNILQDLGTDKKIMDRLLVATTLFFINSTISFVALLFDSNDNGILSHIIITAWIVTLVMSLTSTFYIISILFKTFDYLND